MARGRGEEALSAQAQMGYPSAQKNAGLLIGRALRSADLHGSIWRKGDVAKSMPPVAWRGLLVCLEGRRVGRRTSDACEGVEDVV